MFGRNFEKSFAAWIGAALNLGRGVLAFMVLAGLVFSGLALQPVEPVSAADEAIQDVPDALAAEGISAESWVSIQAQMAVAQYQFTAEGGTYYAPNPEQGLAVDFGPPGLVFSVLGKKDSAFGMLLSDVNGTAVSAGDFSVAEETVTRQGAGVTEALTNDENGFRYGLTLMDVQSETLVLSYDLTGTLGAVLAGDDLLMMDVQGQTVMHLGGLSVTDASGTGYLAAFSLEADRLIVRVSGVDRARLPLAIEMRIWVDETKLNASDAESGDLFGYSVAVSGDVIVVGANGEDAGGSNAGAVYVFQRMQDGADVWGQAIKLTASDAGANDWFGCSVAVSGDVIVVGAIYEDSGGSNAGAAYVFQRMEDTPTPTADAWGQIAKLTASDADVDDYFGQSVAVSGDVIVVGANGEDAGGTSAGAAYVFQRLKNGADDWGQVRKLVAADATSYNNFGQSVAVSGDVIVVGATGEDAGGNSAGAAYVFQRRQGGADVWGQVRKLVASDAAANDVFGTAVAVSGDVIVVGAGGENSSAGAAYVFQRRQGGADVWGQVQKLTASDAAANDLFGATVSVSGDVIVVGADGKNSSTGAAYVYERRQGGADVWGQVQKLTASDAASSDYFGHSAAVFGDVIVIGAFAEGGTGAVYVNQSTAGDVKETVKKTASDAAASDYFGFSVDVSGDVMVVGAYGEDAGGSNAGAAYVFQRLRGGADAWGQVKKLTAGVQAQDGDWLGVAVAVSGDVVVVGAVHDNMYATSDTGSARVYMRSHGGADNWGLLTTLHGNDIGEGDWFGVSVAVSGDVIVVGAYHEDAGGNNAGAAYVFERMQGGTDNWGQVKKLVASDPSSNDQFGNSVAVSGDVIVVGASWKGAAYVYQRMQGGTDNWGQVKKLTPSDPEPTSVFGSAVSVSGDVIVVGASGKDDSAGAAYVFQRQAGGVDQWGQVQKLVASDAVEFDNFGRSVSVSGDVIVVGADRKADSTGAAYVFQRLRGGVDAWGQVQKLTASDAASGDYFGGSVAVSGDVIVVGAYGEDARGSNAGAVYVFQSDLDSADLSLTKTDGPDPINVGGTLTYTLSVTNDGPDAASDITVTDTLPAGVTFQTVNATGWGCSVGSGTVTCSRASLAVGTTLNITITVTAPVVTGDITNSASVTSDTPDPDITNNTDDATTSVEASADLSLTKAASSGAVQVDAVLTYTLSVENLGVDPAQDVVVTDVLPAGVAFQSASGEGWSCSESGGTVTCTRASLAVGAAPDITIAVTAPSTEGDVVNTASVSASTDDPASGNNSDTVTVSVSDLLYFFIPLIIK